MKSNEIALIYVNNYQSSIVSETFIFLHNKVAQGFVASSFGASNRTSVYNITG